MKRNSHARHLEWLETYRGSDRAAKLAWQWLYASTPTIPLNPTNRGD